MTDFQLPEGFPIEIDRAPESTIFTIPDGVAFILYAYKGTASTGIITSIPAARVITEVPPVLRHLAESVERGVRSEPLRYQKEEEL